MSIESDGWAPIESAPKDGTIVELVAFHEGIQMTAVWCMLWDANGANPLSLEITGMWVSPDGEMKWTVEPTLYGPTHWRPHNAVLIRISTL